VPHVTLAQGEPNRGSYGEAVDMLMDMDLRLKFEVRNITLFDWIGPRYEPCDRFPLMGREARNTA
jgi:2'-5' RNA ligase